MIAQELLFVNRLFKLPDLLGIGGSLRMGDSGGVWPGGQKGGIVGCHWDKKRRALARLASWAEAQPLHGTHYEGIVSPCGTVYPTSGRSRSVKGNVSACFSITCNGTAMVSCLRFFSHTMNNILRDLRYGFLTLDPNTAFLAPAAPSTLIANASSTTIFPCMLVLI